MTDRKISQFDNGGLVQTTDEIATNRAGVNTKVFVGSAAAYDVGLADNEIPTNSSIPTTVANSLSGTSSTSNEITVGEKTFLTETNKSFEVGRYLLFLSVSSSSTDSMTGVVTFYDSETGELDVEITHINGSGTYEDWDIYVAGATGTDGTDGDNGWTPVLAVVSDSDRRVLQVVDWVGGEGTEPATGDYVGATGLVPDIADGVDIRGPQGSAGSSIASDVTYDNSASDLTATDVQAAIDELADKTQPATETTAGIQTLQPNENLIINGNFDVWQRGTAFTPAGGDYTADRWVTTANLDGGSIADSAVDRQAFTVGQTDVPGNPEYFARISGQVTGGSGSDVFTYAQYIEGVTRFSDMTITVSFWAKAEAAKTIAVDARQNFGSGGSANVHVNGETIDLTTSWQKFTVSLTLPSISGKTIVDGSYLAIFFILDAGASLATFTEVTGDGNYVDLAQVKVEIGDTATPFVPRKIEEELGLCWRYYEKLDLVTNGINSALSLGGAFSSTTISSILGYNRKRVPPTISLSQTDAIRFTAASGANYSTASLAFFDVNDHHARMTDTGHSGYTVREPVLVALQRGYINIDAEL